jgi:lipopolysaccharide/colanic/teichoic acid biosynthesis glycosyltransferase
MSGPAEHGPKVGESKAGFYRRIGKRLFDLTVAVPALIIFAPILAVTAIIILFKFGRPVLFVQTRPGLNCAPFSLYKFRTMTNERDTDGKLLPDAQRLPAFGKFLRASSIDELPELWNVVRGQMSIVGPRPLLMQYLPLYSKEQMRRHSVRPGLTGLAQISGRNAITWEQKFEFDIKYVDTYSFQTDIAIILRTVQKIATRSGINAPGEATMPYFKGGAASEGENQISGTDEK